MAIKSVNQSPPDLIITDVLMPEMTGYELFINLKRIDSPARRAPIVVMSSKESLQFIFDAQAIISFLPKPFTKTELCSAVEAALKS